MRRLAVALMTSSIWAFNAEAIETDSVGPNHWLRGSTVLETNTRPGEWLELQVSSQDLSPFDVFVRDSTGSVHSFAVSAGSTGSTSADRLRIEVPRGRSEIRFGSSMLTLEQLLLRLMIEVRDPAGPKTGRISSTRWQFNTGSYRIETNASFFVEVAGSGASTVYRLSITGMAGHEFDIAANAQGLPAPYSGLSAHARDTTGYYGVHRIYFEVPDVALAGESEAEAPLVALQDQSLELIPRSAGAVRVALDLDRDGVTPSGPEEVIWSGLVDRRVIEVPMSRDGTGHRIPPGEYDGTVDVQTDAFHFIGFDIETMQPGVRIHRVGSRGLEPMFMHWDDRPIDDGSILLPATPVFGLTSGSAEEPATPANAHGWGGPIGIEVGPGDRTYIDTYVYGARDKATFVWTQPEETATRTSTALGHVWSLDTPPIITPIQAFSLNTPWWLGEPIFASDRESTWTPDVGASRDPAPEGGEELWFGSGCSASGGQGDAIIGLVLAFILLRPRRVIQRRFAGLLLGLLVTAEREARAADADLSAAFSGSGAYALLETQPWTHPGLDLGITTSFARDSVVTTNRAIVHDLLVGQLVASYRWSRRVRMHAVVPASWTLVGSREVPPGFRWGDTRLGVSWIFEQTSNASFSLHPRIRLATGSEVVTLGGVYGVGVSGGVSWQAGRRLELSAQLGTDLATLGRSSLFAVLGAQYNLTSWLTLPFEVSGRSYHKPLHLVGDARPVEATGGLAFHFGDTRMTVRSGMGLWHGVGAPDVRVAVGLSSAFDLQSGR